MVASGDVVAAHQHQVANTQGGCAKQVGLEREPVPIAHRQLHDWLQTLFHEEVGRRQ